MTRPLTIVVHGHFYQPPRENPWTERVPREPSAAPFHDWNERITRESYRPNAFARIVDEHGRVVSIVNNYEHLSYDLGPTLLSWLVTHEPDLVARIVGADRGRGAMAQSYFHVILPLAPERDVRTNIRWGLADFAHRFGRQAEGLWLPEAAVNDDVLRIACEEGVRFTILAPSQAAEPVDSRAVHRWHHPDGGGRGVDIVFYDGDLSHAAAFELGSLSSQALVDRIEAAAPDGGLVAIAADGETFGHHHTYGDRLLAYALAVEAPKRGIPVLTVAEALEASPERVPVDVVESAWSCAHGVERWRGDCGCSTGGEPGWDQRWRAPLRRALDVVREAVDAVFEERGRVVFRGGDCWGARDAYVDVLLGRRDASDFAVEWITGDPVEGLTLLEAQRNRLAMYTSCGWFFNDLAGLETIQVLRYAARALDHLGELGCTPPVDKVLSVLDGARSNVASEGSGRDVWRRHVEPARVDARRTVAHVALTDLLEDRSPAGVVGCFDVEVRGHSHHERGVFQLCSGDVVLTHRRTGRRSEHVYAAIHLGGLEVIGATRAADAARDAGAFARLHDAWAADAPVTTLLRLLVELFGPDEFGLAAALPDAADEMLHRAATELADRFAAAYEQLFADHRATLTRLASAGYPLPAELRAPAELALARRLEAEVARQGGSLDPADYATAVAVAREARDAGVVLDVPRARATVERLLTGVVELAASERDPAAFARALEALEIVRDLGIHPDLDRAQELVYDAMQHDGAGQLADLAAALNLAV